MLNESLIAQRLMNDHMVFNGKKSYEIEITSKLLSHVRPARSSYFSNQKEFSLQTVKSEISE